MDCVSSLNGLTFSTGIKVSLEENVTTSRRCPLLTITVAYSWSSELKSEHYVDFHVILNSTLGVTERSASRSDSFSPLINKILKNPEL
jgi:hypothetical protein